MTFGPRFPLPFAYAATLKTSTAPSVLLSRRSTLPMCPAIASCLNGRGTPMSDPIEAAAEAHIDAKLRGETPMTAAERVVAAYERAKVVCDECDGKGVIADLLTAHAGLCPNAGPMLQGADGPFHADASKLWRWCQRHDQVARYGETVCIDGDLYPDPESECSLVWVDQKVWEEA